MTSFFKSGDAPDQIYRNTRDGTEDHHRRGREYLERLWQEGAPYVDTDAAKKATRDLASVFWELQLVHALRSVGKNLVPRRRLSYKKNKGPGLFAEDKPGAWIEAVVVRSGDGPDKLQYPEPMKVYSYNPDGVVLRLRSAIRDKSAKMQGYIADGTIKPGQATVIAISGVTLPHRFSGIMPPEIVRAVYPANNPVLEINRATMAVSDRYVEYRERVKKSLGAEVTTDVFLDPAFSHISAVLFDETDWVNPPEPPSADMKLVHNSLAATPLPDGWLPAGYEYWWRDGARLESRYHE
jgi:hypothetical protein